MGTFPLIWILQVALRVSGIEGLHCIQDKMFNHDARMETHSLPAHNKPLTLFEPYKHLYLHGVTNNSDSRHHEVCLHTHT